MMRLPEPEAHGRHRDIKGGFPADLHRRDPARWDALKAAGMRQARLERAAAFRALVAWIRRIMRAGRRRRPEGRQAVRPGGRERSRNPGGSLARR